MKSKDKGIKTGLEPKSLGDKYQRPYKRFRWQQNHFEIWLRSCGQHLCRILVKIHWSLRLTKLGLKIELLYYLEISDL
ncbi:MAG: hypothetical protein EZS28_019065 [Streblomastix strix]|uniref:Uncharacterized protein n=1 Tax=Streblomastix strix TaxID=222440 RepID=A0A5J4VS73_9EUKA|nr:MAG: hypothetical protein EZS28_019065 [Streblomastix strix]